MSEDQEARDRGATTASAGQTEVAAGEASRAPSRSAYGICLFLGLLLGAAAGIFLFRGPAVGALAGAGVGLVAAFLYNRRRRRALTKR